MTARKEQTRRTYSMPRDPEAPLNRLADLKDGQPTSDIVAKIGARYIAVIRRSMPKFTTHEWMLIFDALQPPWQADEEHTVHLAAEIAEAISSDKLDSKWQVDGHSFKSRIDRLSYASRQAIGELTEAFWKEDAQSNYAQVLRDKLAILQAATPQQARAALRDRLAPEPIGSDQEE